MPALEATLTMWPVPRGLKRRIASFVPRITPWRLISISRIAVASSSSSWAPTVMIPALLTRMSTGPSRPSTVVEEGGEAGSVGDVERQPERRAPELGRGGLGGRHVDVADRDAGALAGQRQRDRLADPAAAAGDDGDLAVQ